MGLGGEHGGEVGADHLDTAGAQQRRDHATAADIQGDGEIAHHIVQPVQQAFGNIGQDIADRCQGGGRAVAVQAHGPAIEHVDRI